MAGEVSKDLTMRMLLPPEVVKAHEEGIIHFHDADYYAQHMHNCDLVNLDDMLQNGTVISGTLIEKPHSFSTACNIATQIIAQVASSQYGGQSISLTHLAPFVDVSRKKIRRDVEAEMKELGINPGEEKISEYRGGPPARGDQARRADHPVPGGHPDDHQRPGPPSSTVFMYLGEAGDNQRLKSDLAIIIEEMLRQRYQGVKNEAGVWITPRLPQADLCAGGGQHPGGVPPYFYLTKLAAKCTAKRMVPDYISEKKMKEYKLSKGETEGPRRRVHLHGLPQLPDSRPLRQRLGTTSANAKNYDGQAQVLRPFSNQGRGHQSTWWMWRCPSGGDFDKFWKIFDERLELCHKALMCRPQPPEGHPKRRPLPSCGSTGALARLKKGEPIDKLLYGGYSHHQPGLRGPCMSAASI